MTQEEKQLLLKDLCERLPYRVKCRFETTVDTYKTIEFSREGTNGLLVDFDEIYCYWFNEGFMLPYLRLMSSMTEEERKELASITTFTVWTPKVYEWYLEHHFDIHELIERGLALEAPKDMYQI